MKTTATPSIQDINLALVAQSKRQQGKRINRKERRAVDQLRDLYKDATDLKGTQLGGALKSALATHVGTVSEITANPLLTQHLAGLRSRNSATDGEVGQIVKLAGRLSEDEDDAISTTLAHLGLNGTVSQEAVNNISGYLTNERASRRGFSRTRKIAGGLIKGGLLAGGILLAPVLTWFFPAGVVAGAAAMKLGVVAGGLLAGGTAGALLGGRVGRAANSYGVND